MHKADTIDRERSRPVGKTRSMLNFRNTASIRIRVGVTSPVQ